MADSALNDAHGRKRLRVLAALGEGTLADAALATLAIDFALEVTLCGSTAEARALVRRDTSAWDVVLYNPARIESTALISTLREQPESLPAIAVTSRSEDDARLGALREGACAAPEESQLHILPAIVHRELATTKRLRLAFDAQSEDSRVALAESEARFRATFEQTAVGMAHVAPDGRWLRVNQKLCEIVGYSHQAMLALSFQDITHPDDLDADLGQLHQVLAGEIRTYHLEKRYFRSDRSIVWINLTVSLVRKPDGTPDYFISVVEDIDARKQAELRSDDVISHFDLTFDKAPIGVAHLRFGRWLRVNQKLCDLLGYTREALLKMSFQDITHPDDLAIDLAQYERLRAKAIDQFALEKRYLRKDGTTLWVNVTVTMVRKADGEPDYTLSTIEDIDVRKRVEFALKEREARLAAIIESEPECVKLIDAEGLLLEMNPAGLEMLQADSFEQIAGECVYPLVAESFREEFKTLISDAFRGRAGALEYQITGLKGRCAWLDSRVTPLRDASGRVIAALGVTRDVTTRKHAEAALQHRENQLRVILDNVPAMIAFYDPEFRCQYANRHYVEFFSQIGTRVEGRLVDEILGPENTGFARPGLDAARAGSSRHFLAERRRVDGVMRFLEVDVVPDLDAHGQVHGLFTLSADVTERIEGENARVERTRLEAANAELNAFAYNAAHDLRAPLRAISGFAGLLRESDAERLSKDGAHALMRIEGGARRLHELVEALLNYARSAQGQLSVVAVDLRQLAGEAVETLSHTWPGATVELGDLPEVRGDRELIWDVLLNLIGNALKFSAKKPHPRVEIGRCDTDHGAAIYIRDNGAGFDPAYAEKLFGVFQRLHTESDFPGTGIGLAFAQRVLARHGSEIWAESVPGEGATFYFTLPQAPAA